MRHAVFASALLGAVALLPAPPAQAAEDRRVEVINASGRDLQEFYASNAKRNSWEEDILGSDVLGRGRSIVINIDDGSGACVFDFLAVLDGGRRVEKRGVNVCEVSKFTVR